MFAKLALKNIKRSIKDYAIYFFTLVLGVAIFYVFNALDSQTIMMDVTERVRDMLDLMNVLLGFVSVFVSFILGALIIYASRFLIKRRSKEFGLYLVLGMGKRKISLILLLETFFIGLLSLGVGLLFGVIASQFMSVLVANMFDANLTNFHFVFSASACLKTLLYFGIIYVFVMIFNTIIISRQKLINLLSSSKRNEQVKLKNLWLCTIVFIVAAVLLGTTYYLVTAGLTNFIADADGPERLLIPIIMGVVATFLLFWSLSGLLLRIFMSFKGIYYKKLNSFVLRQFSSKVNTTVVSMGFICLMLFVTICVLGSALSINHTMHVAMDEALPVDVEINTIGRRAVDIEKIYQRENINLDELLKDVVQYRMYIPEDIELADTLGETLATVDGEGAIYGSVSISENFIHLGDYNRLAELFGHERLELADDQYAIIADYPAMLKMRNAALASGATVELFGKTLQPKFDHCIEGTINLQISKLNYGIIIVPDYINFDRADVYGKEYLLGNYVSPEHAAEIDQKLYSINNRFFHDDVKDENSDIYYYSVDTRQEIIDNNVGTSALVTFVGLYLGIIFLISSAAVLALKELSESSDNREKYSVLRKIGTSERMLNSALFWQIFIFFLFPLLIAIIHSIFGLMFCDFILSSIGGVDITGSLPGVTLILGAFYGGYFLITYFCSRSIIRARRS